MSTGSNSDKRSIKGHGCIRLKLMTHLYQLIVVFSHFLKWGRIFVPKIEEKRSWGKIFVPLEEYIPPQRVFMPGDT